MAKRANSGPRGKRARAKWEARQQASGDPELRPDATGAVLQAGWETFFTTLNVRLERGLEWRGGAAKLTFVPTFWAPSWEKAIDVRPRRARVRRRRKRSAGSLSGYGQREGLCNTSSGACC